MKCMQVWKECIVVLQVTAQGVGIETQTGSQYLERNGPHCITSGNVVSRYSQGQHMEVK